MTENTQNTNEDPKMHMPEGYSEPQVSHNGPILALLLIVLLFVLGGLYLWGSMLNEEAVMPEEEVMQNEPETTETDDTLSSSDEIDAIEADLNSTDFSSLEAELTTIDTEVNAVFAE